VIAACAWQPVDPSGTGEHPVELTGVAGGPLTLVAYAAGSARCEPPPMVVPIAP
jgi:hypothetical protein